MPTKPATHGEVHSICTHLEVSPSAHSPGSSIYNPGEGKGPHAKKHAPKHRSSAPGRLTGSEASMGSGRRTATKNVPKVV